MDNTFYTCPYCKEEYVDPVDLAHCILSCEDKKKREEEERKQAELKAERDARYKEVVDAYEKFEELRTNYIRDYGHCTIHIRNKDGNSHSWYWNSIGLL